MISIFRYLLDNSISRINLCILHRSKTDNSVS